MKKVLKGISERKDGSMYMKVAENAHHRKRFFEACGLSGRQIAAAELIHGTHVEIVTPASKHLLPKTDALITQAPGIILTLTGADCFPVYLEERSAGIIGLVHCGWRSIVAGIIPETIAVLIEIGGKTDRLMLTLGPGICARHFEIREDILPAFAPYSEYIENENGIRVDLKAIIRKQALKNGVREKNIIDSGECTYCLKDKYFSFRRDQPKTLETQIAYIVQFPHRKF